jgi:ubiquinone/menaquinone biosynthesis C-methylase UbiE
MITDFITPSPITKLAYQTFQQGKNAFGVAHKLATNRFMQQLAPHLGRQSPTHDRTADMSADTPDDTPPITPAIIDEIRSRFAAIAEADWQDAEQGVYPASLLFDHAWEDLLQQYPNVWLDLPKLWERAEKKQFRDIPPNIDTRNYPNYYTQNFHYQTDGYLSESSANLYDLQVELLFNGGADPMRRRVLAPLKQGLKTFATIPAAQIQILDVACGTGRTLKMLRRTCPQASLHGIDLSPAYLRKASQLLSPLTGDIIQLAQGNAEALPYRDHYFHGITCVFLFHELPGPVRQTILNECARVLQPGGTFILCDSIQVHDSPTLIPSMEGFARTFHEPFYHDYIHDDLNSRLTNAGLINIIEQVHYMSKYLIARKL